MKHYDCVILGSGVAAGYAAQEFAGQNRGKEKLAIITADSSVPYDRPPLSKGFLAGEKSAADILINPASFYREQGIEALTNRLVTGVDFAEKKLRGPSDEEYGFEKLLITTGSEP